MVRFAPPRAKKDESDFSARGYLRSVDFDGNVVALRRPLGGFGHFETGADQVDAELSLAGDSGRERPFLHPFIQHVRASHRPVDIWPRCNSLLLWRRGRDGPGESGKTADP